MVSLDSKPAAQICPVCGAAKASHLLACGTCAPGLNLAGEHNTASAPSASPAERETSWVPILLCASGLFLLTLGLLTSRFWTWQNSSAEMQPATGRQEMALVPRPVVLAEWSVPPGAPGSQVDPGHIEAEKLSRSQAAKRGLVWVNPVGRLLVKPGHSWYGNTTEGYYTSEAQARREGARLTLPLAARG